ncbi:mastermind-like protein 2 [Xenopus laevis]|uniref:Mastermind-like protein 2 n=2 Tax=Xenopus laevis TaxID=8355 RepID=A0A1L8HJB6_XENLA|nr:mastermind-like protein 2 [Xenopus laevis]OCT96166.1 hypothetical protein XELAEV_18013849mg [Xenopus laevis]
MGETAPPQAPAGNLGIGVAGAGLLGGGSVTPRIHSAIVERLRARIAVCRQHHLNCEGRYERSRAESSDRERENTLHLLTLVQHGQGPRKNNKHNKSTCAPPPDYHHHQQQQQHLQRTEGKEINGNQQPHSSNGLNQRNSALIALQGSLKRRLVVSPPQSKRANGISDHSFLDFKKLRNEHLLAAQSEYHNIDGLHQLNTGDAQMELSGPRSTIHSNNNSNCNSNDLFGFALKDIKKEPGEAVSCGKHLDIPLSHENQMKCGEDSGEQFMDPDLQELFNELTYISVPPMSDTELQNMINITIKQDEPFHIDLGHQNQRTSSSMPLDKVVIKSEYSPGLDSACIASPQMRPSSTGPAFPIPNAPLTSSPNTTAPQNPSQTQVPGTNRLHSWQELSHAQQLKQIAANRQNNIIHQHQPNQPSSWPNMSPNGLTPRPFGDVNIPSSFRHQQLSSHSPSTSNVPVNGAKMMSSYLYKQNASSQNSTNELIKTQDSAKCAVNATHSTQEQIHSNIKPLFHFNHDQSNQQMSSVVNNPSKPVLQYPQQKQPTSSSKQHHEQVQSVSNQQLSRPTTFQQKMTFTKLQQNQPISGLHYSSVHPQQDQHSAAAPGTPTSSKPTSCASPNTGNGYTSQQPLSAQQLMEKANVLQRQMMEQKQQLLLQQQMLVGMEKSNSQDQMSHLNRPPPDYKDQRRSSVGLQQASQYTSGLPTGGVNQSPPATTNPVSTHNLTPPNPNHSSPNHSSRMTPLQGAQNMYGNPPCSQQVMYNASPGTNQMQQQTNPNTTGNNQNSHILPRRSPTAQGNPLPPFSAGSATSPPQFRASLNHGTNMAGQRPPNGMNNSSVSQNWPSQEAKKQSGLCFSNTNQFSSQPLQGILGSQNFAPNPPELQMRAQMSQAPAGQGQTMEPLRGFNNSGQAQMRAQLSPNPNQGGGGTAMAANTFTSPNPVPRGFPGSDTSNDLGSFDFLSTNSDFDFIDTLLKTGHANDDWIKDIILDEIFKNHA